MAETRKIALAVVVIVIILGVAFAALYWRPPAPPAPPAVEYQDVKKIYVTVRTLQETGIADVGTGKLDAFIWSALGKVYAGMPPEILEQIDFVRCSSTYWAIVVNPAYNMTKAEELGLPTWPIIKVGDKEVFNPFAIREVRYALNWLINRKYIVDAIMGGSGDVMYGAIRPSHAAASYFVDIYEELGLTPSGDLEKAGQMIDDALTYWADIIDDYGYTLEKVSSPDSPAGYWWAFNGEIIELTFLIRIEDERHEEGLYIADQLEKVGIKINRYEADRYTLIPIVYGTDPFDWQWNLYTEGWVSMVNWRFPEDTLMWFYSYDLGFAGFYLAPGWITARNETIEDISWKLYAQLYTDMDEYWELNKELLKIGIQESVRVFVAENWEFFPVNKRVKNYIFDVTSGLWARWFLMTMQTPTGEATVAEFSSTGALFMSAWNPVGGFLDVYSEVLWMVIHDYGFYVHPLEGEPIEVRNHIVEMEKNYDVDPVTGEIIPKLDVPSDAVIYNSTAKEWVTIGEGHKAAVRVRLKIDLSNWHHGQPMTLTDVIYALAFIYDWSTEDYPGDPFYDPNYEYAAAPWLSFIVGWKFLGNDTYEVYGRYIYKASDRVTADYYSVFPTVPWELMEGMAQTVVHGGNVTGNVYSWYELAGYEQIDMISPEHLKDVKSSIQTMMDKDYIPAYWNGLDEYKPSTDDADARYNATITWMDEHGHFVISNGPFYLESYDPEHFFAILEAFWTDPTYPYEPSYWRENVFITLPVIEDIEAPAAVNIAEPTDVHLNISVTLAGEPAENVTVEIIMRNPEGIVIYTAEAEMVEPGLYRVTIPADVFEGLTPGSYTIEVRVTYKGIPVTTFIGIALTIGG